MKKIRMGADRLLAGASGSRQRSRRGSSIGEDRLGIVHRGSWLAGDLPCKMMLVDEASPAINRGIRTMRGET